MNTVTESLLAWYDRSARVLPWRGIHDAYRTWVSEMMLQQTRVETVLPYYDRFLRLFPDLPSLASASEEEVLKAWEGLGYYTRARNLWKGAKQVISEYGGMIPSDPAALRKISGIGPYSAAAIASIAYDVPVPAVDGNVIRVLSRLCGIRGEASSAPVQDEIRKQAASLLSGERPGDHNQALMDLGAMICTPGTPDCRHCPLTVFCDAFRTGDAAELPHLAKSKPPKTVPYAVLLIFSGNRVLMRQRSENLLRGMWCFPMFEEKDLRDELAETVLNKLHLTCSPPVFACSARHVFTHLIWQMSIYKMNADAEASAPSGYRFIPFESLQDLPVPAAMYAALKIVSPES